MAKKVAMTTLTCEAHPELLSTYPHVEFHDGHAETDEATAQIVIDELGEDYGIALADEVPAEAPAEAPAEGE